jgi:nitrogen regulatory protein P-II 1
MIPKKILVLKNEGSLEIDSHEWLDMEILNYNQISIDGKKTCLLKEPCEDNFYSLNEKISEKDGIMIFSQLDQYECLLNLEENLIEKRFPYVILKDELYDEIQDKENHLFFNSDNYLQTIIMAMNRISSLINKVDSTDGMEKNRNEELKTPIISSKAMNSSPYFENKEFEIRSYNNEIEMQSTDSLKKIRFSLHPIMLDTIKSSLEKLGFSNITLKDIKLYDSSNSSHETYRGSSYEMNAKKWQEVMIVVRENEVDFIVNLLKNLKNDDISNYVTISPTFDAMRIRTGEKGSYAID